MICIGLERFFELPIIQAPKRNSKLYKDMWKNSVFCRASLGAGYECAALHEACRSSREMGGTDLVRLCVSSSIVPIVGRTCGNRYQVKKCGRSAILRGEFERAPAAMRSLEPRSMVLAKRVLRTMLALKHGSWGGDYIVGFRSAKTEPFAERKATLGSCSF
jgi:hypothetical protein